MRLNLREYLNFSGKSGLAAFAENCHFDHFRREDHDAQIPMSIDEKRRGDGLWVHRWSLSHFPVFWKLDIARLKTNRLGMDETLNEVESEGVLEFPGKC